MEMKNIWSPEEMKKNDEGEEEKYLEKGKLLETKKRELKGRKYLEKGRLLWTNGQVEWGWGCGMP